MVRSHSLIPDMNKGLSVLWEGEVGENLFFIRCFGDSYRTLGERDGRARS